jgi:hypothetical protein|tara:strand:- start:475 stop:954 length:480 start_codon:yes stop_codon:yes gene_type:complete
MPTAFNAAVGFNAAILFDGVWVAAGDWANDGDANLAAQQITAARLNSSVLKQNTVANRPAAAAGRSGEMFYATDEATMYIYEGTGGSGMWRTMFLYDSLTLGSLRTLGTGAEQAASGDHNAQHEPSGGDTMTVDAAAGVGSLRTLGTGATQAAAGNHTH